MAASTTPRVRRTPQNTLFTYNLSRRVNDVQTYPVASPQGATIIIYGHDNGVTLLWRGGRRFKPTKTQPAAAEKRNGSGGAPDDSVMIIDSDDEAPPAKTQGSAPAFVDKPQFEDEVEQGTCPEIIQTLDVTLGTAVRRVAVMPLTPCAADEAAAAAGGAQVLGETMVFAVSCVTNDVYVITIPLTPPSPESKARPELRSDLLAGNAGSGSWGESLVLLGGQSKHADGLAITWAKSNREVTAVVAAHSREACGVMRLWDVPLDVKTGADRAVEPFQTEYLPNPLTSISFNQTHTTQLLAVSSPHATRIYDFARPSLPADSEAPGTWPVQGSWLISLYQPFARQSSIRKPILDAEWICHGKAVFALMADGMWGIWDIDGVSPSTSGTAMSSKLQSGVRGAATTAFSVSGYVEGTSTLRNAAAPPKDTSTGEFNPMTPHTRKQVTVSLGSMATLDRLSTIRGGIKVTALPSRGKALQDESVALWVGGLEHVCVISGISHFWDSQLRKGSGGGVNLFSGAPPTRMVKLLDLSTGLLGERFCGVGLALDRARLSDTTATDGGLPVDVLIRGESRIVIVREGGEEGPGKKIGGVRGGRRNRLFSKGERSDAIIVHGTNGKPSTAKYDLSTARSGSLRYRPSALLNQDDEGSDVDMDEERTLQLPSRSRGGFAFSDTLNLAADVTSDDIGRDVEAEMLDIMEIDQALTSLEDYRGTGRERA